MSTATGRRFSRCFICCAPLLLLTIFGVVGLGHLLAPPAPPNTAPPTLAGVLGTARTHYKLPAVAGALITLDSIETAATGVTRRGGTAAVTPEQYWHLGSNSKAITATLAALLVADGQLEPATTPEQLWPAAAGQLDPGYRGVTLHELLTHRAGVPPYTAGSEFEGLPDFPGGPQQRALAFSEYVLSRPPAGKRGEFIYSNAGYAIAGAMLAEAGGAPYLELLHDRLTGPLGLDCAAGWPVSLGPGQPWGHSPGLLGMFEVHDPADGYALDDFMAPAGDLALPIADYARFVQLHLRGLRGLPPLADPALARKVPRLTAELIQELHQPVGDYACGWGISGTEAAPRSAHEGSLGTFHCITVVAPASGRAVFVVTNAGGDRAASAVQWAAQALLGE